MMSINTTIGTKIVFRCIGIELIKVLKHLGLLQYEFHPIFTEATMAPFLRQMEQSQRLGFSIPFGNGEFQLNSATMACRFMFCLNVGISDCLDHG